MPVILNVRAGSTRWCNFSINVTSLDSLPTGAANPNGNHPNSTAKTITTNSPIQNTGVDANIRQNVLMNLSTILFLRLPDKIPRRKPITPVSTQAVPISHKEASKRSAITFFTG